MKALTVKQPWAWAIMRGGKSIENRSQVWSYRGPLAIHAGQAWSKVGASDLRVNAVAAATPGGAQATRGAILGVVDLVDCHTAQGDCCPPWGDNPDAPVGPLDQIRHRAITHLVLRNPRPLAEPIPARGALGLWTPPREIVQALIEVSRG